MNPGRLARGMPPPPPPGGPARGNGHQNHPHRFYNHGNHHHNNFRRGGRGRGRGGRGGHGRWGGRERNDNNNNHRHHGRGGGRHRNQGYNNNPSSFDPIEEIGPAKGHGSSNATVVRIAVEGCCHGELDLIYDRLAHHERESGRKTDLLVCCGDFQALRNPSDFLSSSIPPKYRRLGDFGTYYAGTKKAPILTVFIGGNHEASQALRELYYGGWVAPNIYYLGAAGVIRYRGIRIGGISGIYKSHDYSMGHFERIPYDHRQVKSVYHVRNVDVARMKLLATKQKPEDNGTKQKQNRRLDVVVSHDWPQGIEQFGDTRRLIRSKPFFKNEIDRNDLGSPPNRELLDALQPRHWFSAHLHVKFRATVVHNHGKATKTKHPSGAPTPEPKSALPPTTSLLTPSQAKPKAGTKSRLANQQAQALQALFDAQGQPEESEKNKDDGFLPLDENYAPDTNEEDDKEAQASGDSNSQGGTAEVSNGSTPATEFHGLETSKSKCIPGCDDNPLMAMNPVEDLTEQMTRFLALDKALPRRQFLSILNLELPSTTASPSEIQQEEKSPILSKTPKDTNDKNDNNTSEATIAEGKDENLQSSTREHRLEYDPEWLAIVKKTHHWAQTERRPVMVPPPLESSDNDTRYDEAWVRGRFRSARGTDKEPVEEEGLLEIPRTFVRTVPTHTDEAYRGGNHHHHHPPPLPAMGNPQTDWLLGVLELDHVLTQPYDPLLTPEAIAEGWLRGDRGRSAGHPNHHHHHTNHCNHHNHGNPNNKNRGSVATETVEDENEIDIDGDGNEEEGDALVPVENHEAKRVVAAAAAVDDDDNEIDIDLDDDDEESDDHGGDKTAAKEAARKIPTTEDDDNEIDIDEESDDESSSSGANNAIAKKARLGE